MKTEAAARVRAYLARHAKNRQGDPRAIHGYDLGEPSEAELLVADLKTLSAQAEPGNVGNLRILADIVRGRRVGDSDDIAKDVEWAVGRLETIDTDCVSLLADLDAGKPCTAEAAAVIRQFIREREEATAELLSDTQQLEAPAEAGEIDLYDDKVQAGIAWTMRQWGETLGLKTWTQGDGSESVEGDVGAEIHTILVDAGLRDPETNEMASLRAQPQAREDAQPVGWLRAADEEMVCAHLGVAEAGDSYETAKQKLASLIQWNIAVAMDPSVGGRPAPDALRVALEALEKIADARVFDERGEDYRGIAHPYRACRADETEQVAIKALAALQAEQKGGAA